MLLRARAYDFFQIPNGIAIAVGRAVQSEKERKLRQSKALS